MAILAQLILSQLIVIVNIYYVLDRCGQINIRQSFWMRQSCYVVENEIYLLHVVSLVQRTSSCDGLRVSSAF